MQLFSTGARGALSEGVWRPDGNHQAPGMGSYGPRGGRRETLLHDAE